MKLLKWMVASVAVMGLFAGCGPVPDQDPAAPQQSRSELGVVHGGDEQAPPCSACDGICDYYGWESVRCVSCWSFCIDY